MGQRFFISAELYLDLKPPGMTDDLNKTVNYAELCHKIEQRFIEKKFDLIESCAEYLANIILNEYTLIDKVKINIKKPSAPIGKPLKYVGVEIERGWHTAFIGLGSNLGDKEGNLKLAIDMIKETEGIKVTKQSQVYITKPVGYTDQDNFANSVIQLKTLKKPKELLETMLKIEEALKRERIIRWGPRTIDLDILLYDDIVTTDENIVVPHPRMHERLFVLKPLSDIAPYYIHPLLNKTIIQLWEEVTKSNKDF
jgi:dihydroneopterin aldolase/2-amino-4-hydroxy-6-hydroxymethyldihydropteridine diphosphokinase